MFREAAKVARERRKAKKKEEQAANQHPADDESKNEKDEEEADDEGVDDVDEDTESVESEASDTSHPPSANPVLGDGINLPLRISFSDLSIDLIPIDDIDSCQIDISQKIACLSLDDDFTASVPRHETDKVRWTLMSLIRAQSVLRLDCNIQNVFFHFHFPCFLFLVEQPLMDFCWFACDFVVELGQMFVILCCGVDREEERRQKKLPFSFALFCRKKKENMPHLSEAEIWAEKRPKDVDDNVLEFTQQEGNREENGTNIKYRINEKYTHKDMCQKTKNVLYVENAEHKEEGGEEEKEEGGVKEGRKEKRNKIK